MDYTHDKRLTHALWYRPYGELNFAVDHKLGLAQAWSAALSNQRTISGIRDGDTPESLALWSRIEALDESMMDVISRGMNGGAE